MKRRNVHIVIMLNEAAPFFLPGYCPDRKESEMEKVTNNE